VKSGRYSQPVRILGQNIAMWQIEDIRALIERGLMRRAECEI